MGQAAFGFDGAVAHGHKGFFDKVCRLEPFPMCAINTKTLDDDRSWQKSKLFLLLFA